MIVANLATYPPRREAAIAAAKILAPQVDQLNIVLNEYNSALGELADVPNVNQIIPPVDTKDVGKFFPDVTGADYVFYVDDDVVYPTDYVQRTIERFDALGPGRYLAGYHASIYERPKFSLLPGRFLKWLSFDTAKIANFRKVYRFFKPLENPVIVDQIATNAAIIRGADAPSYEFMADSQKFVDVRLARWCFENGIVSVALPREGNWFGKVSFEETIFGDFTRKHFPKVSAEIMTFAFRNPDVGQTIRR